MTNAELAQKIVNHVFLNPHAAGNPTLVKHLVYDVTLMLDAAEGTNSYPATDEHHAEVFAGNGLRFAVPSTSGAFTWSTDPDDSVSNAAGNPVVTDTPEGAPNANG